MNAARVKGWKVIKERIHERFNITPPTTRAMQKWEQHLDRAALSAEVMKDVKGKMGVIEAEALQSAQGLLATYGRQKTMGGIWKWPDGNGSFIISITDLATRNLKFWWTRI